MSFCSLYEATEFCRLGEFVILLMKRTSNKDKDIKQLSFLKRKTIVENIKIITISLKHYSKYDSF